MNQLVPVSSTTLPALVLAAGERALMRFLEFFAANIRNPASSAQRCEGAGGGGGRGFASSR